MGIIDKWNLKVSTYPFELESPAEYYWILECRQTRHHLRQDGNRPLFGSLFRLFPVKGLSFPALLFVGPEIRSVENISDTYTSFSITVS